MSRQQRAAILVVLAGTLAALLLHPYLSGLLGALVLTVIGSPLYRRIRTRRHPRIAAAIVVVIAIAFVLAPGIGLGLIAIDRFPEVVQWFEESGMRERLATLHVAGADVGARLADMSGALLEGVSRQVLRVAAGALSAVLNLVIAIFGLYYLLLSGDDLWVRVRAVIPFSSESAEALRQRFRSVTHATIVGTLALAALQGAAAGLTFWLIGLPHAVVWGMLTAFAAVVPVVGTGLVWVPATLILVVMERYTDALLLGAVGAIVVANLDNLVRPLVYRRVSRIHPMITLVGAFAGIQYFGPLGVLFGPLGLAYFVELVALYRRDYAGVGRTSVTDVPRPAPSIPAPPPFAISPVGEQHWEEP